MTTEAKLTLTFDAGFGKRYTMSMPIDEHTAREFQDIQPPIKHGLPFVPGLEVALDSFDAVVEVLTRREFRKDVFQTECRRLGALLAERMEDAEGWHDVSRIEPAKAALRD